MSNLTKLEFSALDISGKNYLSWTLDAKIHLETKNFGDTIKHPRRIMQNQEFLFIIIYMKIEYFTKKDPSGEVQVLEELAHAKSLA